MAQNRERVVQSVLTLGVTLAIFSYAAAPPVVFAIMPMFAWLAFRGTLREASLLLAGVGAIATGMTVLGLGPVHELLVRYDLDQELVNGFLQLFLLDCALILLPLAVHHHPAADRQRPGLVAPADAGATRRRGDRHGGVRDRQRGPGRPLQPRRRADLRPQLRGDGR